MLFSLLKHKVSDQMDHPLSVSVWNHFVHNSLDEFLHVTLGAMNMSHLEKWQTNLIEQIH